MCVALVKLFFQMHAKDVVELSDGPKVCAYSYTWVLPLWTIFLAHIQSALKFTWVSNLDEVLLNAFDGGLKSVCKL